MRPHRLLVLLTILGTTACPSDDGSGDDAAGTGGDADTPMSIVSYNVGLAFGYVSEASGRKDTIITALAESDADVVCLQELWTNQNDAGEWTTDVIEEVLAGSVANFPHQYWARTTTSDTAPPQGCSVEESEPLEACAATNCADVAPENLADCVLTSCADEFNATAAGCQSCLAGNLGMPFEDIVAACKGVISSGVVYDGHNGLAILSKHPLAGTEIDELEYALTSRAILHATVTPEGAPPVDLYCTHLASDLSTSIDYPPGGAYASFAEENAAQANALLAWADSTATAPTVVLAGDFNHGPMIGTGHAELDANYQLMVAAGYTDPIADSGEYCSYCSRNLLQDGGGTDGELIDHIYVRGTFEVVSASIVYDDAVDVVTADGPTTQLHRSDHFGVRVDLLH
jgi:endonuclease/exonuclease/phosphatase family metal-dependent hydrolase